MKSDEVVESGEIIHYPILFCLYWEWNNQISYFLIMNMNH